MTCLSTVDCFAVGDQTDSSVGQRSFLEQYTGKGWVSVPLPEPGETTPDLFGVTCASTTDCIAVGTAVPQDSAYEEAVVDQTAFLAPLQPSAVAAVAGSASAVVSWAQPLGDGGAPVTSYTVTPYAGSSALPPTTVTGSPPPTWALVSGLSDGTTYDFTVTAANEIGSSPE